MKHARFAALTLALLVALVLASCRPRLAACPTPGDRPEERMEIEPAAGLDSGARGAGAEGGGEPTAGGGAGALEPVTPFGILTPAFSGVGADSITAACDPLDDLYSDCL